MARQLFEVVSHGEGPETNLFGSEYIVSIAAAGASDFSEGSGDYGIWTSESGPSSLDLETSDVEAATEMPRKKAA